LRSVCILFGGSDRSDGSDGPDVPGSKYSDFFRKMCRDAAHNLLHIDTPT
jgi:hypothetical protein